MVLAPWNDPIPFTRAWCLFEIYSTVVTGSKFEVAMIESERESFIRAICFDPYVFYKMLADIDVKKSDAWNKDDLTRILEVTEKEVGLDKVNLIVKAKMREWADATLKHATEHSDGAAHVYSEDELLRMMALAANLKDTGKYADSLQLFQKCISGYLALPDCSGPEDHVLSPLYNNMAIVHRNLKEYDLALTNYIKALNIDLVHYGPTSTIVADIYLNMGGLYSEQCKYNKAIEYYTKALDIHLTSDGPTSTAAGDTYGNIAIVHSMQGNYELALEYYNKALPIKLSLGANHPSVGNTYGNMGNLYYVQKKYDRAMDYYKKALAICLSLGEDHHHVKNMYRNIARVYEAQGDMEKARELRMKI
jgi:tetratricopeptide (TPR) repeat protein